MRREQEAQDLADLPESSLLADLAEMAESPTLLRHTALPFRPHLPNTTTLDAVIWSLTRYHFDNCFHRRCCCCVVAVGQLWPRLCRLHVSFLFTKVKYSAHSSSSATSQPFHTRMANSSILRITRVCPSSSITSSN